MPLFPKVGALSLCSLACCKHKVRCDKTVPCSRCLRTGIKCEREIVRITKSGNKYLDEIDFLKQLLLDMMPGANSLETRLKRRIALLEHGDPELDLTTIANMPTSAPGRSSLALKALQPTQQSYGSQDFALAESLRSADAIASSSSPAPNYSPAQHQDPNELNSRSDEVAVNVLEYLAWGRHYGNCYPHRSCECRRQRPWSEIWSINCDLDAFDRSLWAQVSTLDVPCDDDTARRLVAFHAENIMWHHNVFHGPTFQKQCEIFWEERKCDHPSWLALYSAVLGVTLPRPSYGSIWR